MNNHPFLTQSIYGGILFVMVFFIACEGEAPDNGPSPETINPPGEAFTDTLGSISEPLVTHIFTADPSAHVFENQLYIYPSHDVDAGIPADDMGSHFDMRDYPVFSMDSVGGEVTDHGVALSLEDVPWAHRQMWAPDAAHKDSTYYFYFPAKDEQGIFRIGGAIGNSPAGPFEPMDKPIEGSYSMDPAVFEDTDGTHYMYFGGIWGGQLQRWQDGEYHPEDVYPAEDEPAISPRVARMADDMVSFDEELQEVLIVDENGDPIRYGDNDRRFFEGPWVHKYEGKYYLSYSTGDTHYLVYAVGDNPYGPFTYQGVILEPVVGWTTHHSIVEFRGNWYLFYHDSSLSGGVTHLRSMKMTELNYNPDGTIQTIDPYPYDD